MSQSTCDFDRMGKTNPDELTPQQRLFCHEYLIDLNATQAASRAGYKEKSAGNQGYVLLNTPKIKEEIQRLMDARSAKVDVNAETVLRELLLIATSDLRKVFNEKGSLLPVDQWPDDIAKSISGVEIEDLFDGHGEDRVQVGYTKKVKMWDKPKALELIGRHLKLFTDKIEIEGDLSIAESMRKARERAKEK